MSDHREDIKPDFNGKPPYRVPSMDDVRAIPWNGLTVASTFAGCGGSSLGYRMAGYRVLWASEFVPAAQESYRANMREGTVLDGRDVRLVQPDEVLAACGLKIGDLDVLDGSPPCQAFSAAGRREKGWGKDRTYEHGAKQRNEDMFQEYVRLLRGLMPRAFVAENVSGLVKGVAKGYFLDILRDLKASGYLVEARVLNAQWLGVPQQRQRVIFVGVRDDIGLSPAFPDPLPYRYSIRDAIPWITSASSAPTGFGAGQMTADKPAPTVPASMQAPYGQCEVEVVKVRQQQDAFDKRVSLVEPSPTILVTQANQFVIERESDISRYAIGDEADKLLEGKQSDRYPSLRRADSGKPSPTLTAAAGCSSLAGVIHPTEKRKFSIAELKRICAFPDDFVLTGTYAQQWERLGNSVPPLMMRAVAEVLRDNILLPARSRTSVPVPRSLDRSTNGKPRTGAARPRPARSRARTASTRRTAAGAAGTPAPR